MWLVLADRADEAALWAYLGLKRRVLDPLEFVMPEELAAGARFHQFLSAGGDGSAVELRDGRRLEGSRLRGVLNRLAALPEPPPASPDSGYISNEYSAWLMSWLAGLACPVLSPPGCGMLCGDYRSDVEWRVLAAEAGLDFEPLRVGSEEDAVPGESPLHTVFVVNGETIAGNAPEQVRSGCARLAELAGAPLLGLDFESGSGGWLFRGASPLPDLRAGGAPLLDSLARALRS